MKTEFNEEQIARFEEIKEAIESLCLGTIEWHVIQAAQQALIENWDDHE